jgi:hypothetical protein
VKHYEGTLSLAEARRIYFDENGFGPNGGYDDAWVDFKLGPVPFPFPNTKPRVRAVKYHDLHHVVTGYETDFSGEVEIGAWEIGSGCADMVAAWQLNLGAMGVGLLVAPRRSWRAFRLGRATKNFYRASFDDALLATTVGNARARLGLDRDGAAPSSSWDLVLFLAFSVFGLAMGVVLGLLFAPLALVAAWPLRLLASRNQRG